MEKRKKAAERSMDWNGMGRAVLMGVAAAGVLFFAGLLVMSALISRGVVPMAQLPAALCAVYALEAFGAAAFLALLQKRKILPAALLAQAVLFAVLLLLGMLFYEAQTSWLQMAAAMLAAALATLAAVALVGGKGKKGKTGKNFKKNSPRRLKRK